VIRAREANIITPIGLHSFLSWWSPLEAGVMAKPTGVTENIPRIFFPLSINLLGRSSPNFLFLNVGVRRGHVCGIICLVVIIRVVALNFGGTKMKVSIH